MPTFARRHRRRHHLRDRYLDSLASEPLLDGLPRHLIPVIGRAVDIVHLVPGASLRCAPTQETFVVTQGLALCHDPDGHSVALVGPGGVVGPAGADGSAIQRISALTEVSCFVIAKRDLPALLEIAPRIADAITRARFGETAVWPLCVERAPGSVTSTTRIAVHGPRSPIA